jgi:class 3 adenylate cyclase
VGKVLGTSLPETRYARRGDIHIAYQVAGEGDLDLVLVSSWFSHLEARWDIPTFAHYLRRLSSFGRLISFDKYGMGLSDPIPSRSLPPIEEWMDDVRAVMDAVGSERAAILGLVEGGLMAAMFAASYPDRTSALVLANTTAKTSWGSDYPIGIPPEGQEMVIGLVEQAWGRPDLMVALNPSLAEDEASREAWARLLRLSASPATAAGVVRTLFQLDLREVLSTIQAPTLVIHRSDNQMVTVENGRYLAEHISGARFVELPGSDYTMPIGDVDAMLDEVEEFLTGARGQAAVTDRLLATVLFTDIVQSTERAAQVGDHRWNEMLDAHDELTQRQLARYQGRLVKTTGDGLLATFDGPARAIRSALAIRDGLRRLGMEIRGGLHTGEIEGRGEDVSGIAVHIAARVQAVAQPGEVLASRTVKDLVAGSGIGFTDRGTHRLKGLPDAWQLFAVEA